MLGLFSSIGGYEILIILAVILLLFGGKKLPELARGLGKGIREFKKELHGVKNVDDNIDDEKQLTKEEDPYNHKDDTDGDKA